MSKILVISDLHQDDRALESVLHQSKDYDHIWFLGDVVGHEDHMLYKYSDYKGNARACYEMLRENNILCITGNWESWLLQPEKDEDVAAPQHKYADELKHARAALGKNGLLSWVSTWPADQVASQFTLVHGSIDSYDNGGGGTFQPNEIYLSPNKSKIVNRIILHKKLTTPHMLFGHTHVPGFFTCNDYYPAEWKGIYASELNENFRYESSTIQHKIHFFINPGSASLNRNTRNNEFWDGVYGTVMEIDTKDHTFCYLPVTI